MEAEVLDFIDVSGNQPVVNEELLNSTDYEKWVKEGLSLNKDYSDYKWRLGDWWNKGHKYGERKKLVESDDWDGPKFGTCANAGSVCEAFESSRRREPFVLWTSL